MEFNCNIQARRLNSGALEILFEKQKLSKLSRELVIIPEGATANLIEGHLRRVYNDVK